MRNARLLPSILLLAALFWPAGLAAQDRPGCSGWDCLIPDPLAAGVLLAAVAAAAAAAALLLAILRHQPRNGSESLADQIERRDWPVLVTRRDGRVVAANRMARQAGPAGATVVDMLEPQLGLGAPEVYRMARMAVQEGLALERFSPTEANGTALLAVTLAGRNRLIWQLMPAGRSAALLPGGQARDYEAVPFGYLRLNPEEGAAANALFHEVFGDEAVGILREQVDAGVFTPGRTILPGADGRDRLALTAIRTERDGSDESHEIFLFIPDSETSGQVSAAETLEAIPVSLVHLDLEGRILWGNAQAREMLGKRFTVGAMLDEIVQPLGRSFGTLLNDARSGRGGGGGEMVRLRDSSYETFAQVSLTRMTLQGQPSIIAVLTDASELRQLEDKFAQSQKMEAVGKLAGGVAHDFNNVLTAISGHCDLLLLRKDASHPEFSDLMQIRQNANRAATLVRQLLAFSRKQTLQPTLISVQDVVTDTLYLLDRLVGETITLSLDHGRDLGSVRADHQQLEQALMNLVVNARDAMPKGGTVRIATRNVTIAVEERKRGVSVPSGEYVEISVSDAGHGIDPQVIDKVFDPFFTTKPKGEGTGLGLSTVYGIIKQSGGYIYAENLDGGGARFTILLPRAWPDQETAAADAVAAEPGPAAPDLTGEGSVMLVEDEAPVRAFAARALKLRGYRVIEAASAEEAMAIVSGGDESVDVLVSDVVMPGMDGPTFAAQARELMPDLRVIFISGYAEESFRRNLKDPDFLFLSKPFSLNELTAKVKIAMDARSTTATRPAGRGSAADLPATVE